MNRLTPLLSCISILACYVIVRAQNDLIKKDYLEAFDQIVGLQNTPLFDGLGYLEKYRTINEKHQFFHSKDFITGSIHYDDQLYPEIPIKYDLFTDEVIINIQKGFEVIALQPDKGEIESFTIDGQRFTNIHFLQEPLDMSISGYFEILFDSPMIKLLKKYTKKMRTKKGANSVYYEFVKANYHVLLYEGRYYMADSNRDFMKIFPEFKKEIRKYPIRKNNEDQSLTTLTRRLHLLLNE